MRGARVWAEFPGTCGFVATRCEFLLPDQHQLRPDLSNPTDLSQGSKFSGDCVSSCVFCSGIWSYISITSSPPLSFGSPSPSSPSPASPMGAFMPNPENVDARYGAFHNVSGSQYHINQLIGSSSVYVGGCCRKLTFCSVSRFSVTNPEFAPAITRKPPSPPPPYEHD